MIRTLIQLLLKPFLAATCLYLCSLPENLYFDPPLLSYVVMFLVTLARTAYGRTTVWRSS